MQIFSHTPVVGVPTKNVFSGIVYLKVPSFYVLSKVSTLVYLVTRVHCLAVLITGSRTVPVGWWVHLVLARSRFLFAQWKDLDE